MFATILLLLAMSQQRAPAPSAPEPLKLSEVRSIYVAPVGGELRNFIMLRIAKWRGIRLAQSTDDADAILSGASETLRSYQNSSDSISEDSIYQGEFMLTDRKTQVPIWSTEQGKHLTKWFFLEGVSGGRPNSPSKLADAVVSQLQKDFYSTQKSPSANKK